MAKLCFVASYYIIATSANNDKDVDLKLL